MHLILICVGPTVFHPLPSMQHPALRSLLLADTDIQKTFRVCIIFAACMLTKSRQREKLRT